MITLMNERLAEFSQSAELASVDQWDSPLTHELLRAPHRPPSSLPTGMCAVYIFSLSESYGETCAAGPNRVLKVGKVGSNSAPRFCSQHYSPNSANSNLAKSLLKDRVLWPYLGINELSEGNVKDWMLKNLDRDHIFVTKDSGLEREIEKFFRGHFGPVFEG